MYVPLKELPECIVSVLHKNGYNKKDVNVTITKELSYAHSSSGDGLRAWVALINLETSEVKEVTGSWGGVNPFEKKACDYLPESMNPLVYNMVLIKGQFGYYNHAELFMHPDNMVKFLPSKEELTQEEKKILKGLKIYIGQSRKEVVKKMSQEMKDKFVRSGFIKINKAGAITITTEGKNACNDYNMNYSAL